MQAGSERQGKSGATGARLKEAASINKSLSALGNVILALVNEERHVPYRSSVLTRLLRDCLGGRSSTFLICNVSPASNNRSETLSSLRFATRVKSVQNETDYVNVQVEPSSGGAGGTAARAAAKAARKQVVMLSKKNRHLEVEVARLNCQVSELQALLDEERTARIPGDGGGGWCPRCDTKLVPEPSPREWAV